jgi:hypothetical protein
VDIGAQLALAARRAGVPTRLWRLHVDTFSPETGSIDEDSLIERAVEIEEAQ